MESVFQLYIKTLIDFIRSRLGKLLFAYGNDRLKLRLPAYRECPSTKKDVKPDIVLLCPNSSEIMLVGEAKTFGSHVRKLESQKGQKLTTETHCSDTGSDHVSTQPPAALEVLTRRRL